MYRKVLWWLLGKHLTVCSSKILEWLLGHGCDRRDVVDKLACTLSITYYNTHVHKCLHTPAYIVSNDYGGFKSFWMQKCVRSGIRTHAYKSRLRPERSALDRSAILTCYLLQKLILYKEQLSNEEAYIIHCWTAQLAHHWVSRPSWVSECDSWSTDNRCSYKIRVNICRRRHRFTHHPYKWTHLVLTDRFGDLGVPNKHHY